jgi:hypothetical protein
MTPNLSFRVHMGNTAMAPFGSRSSGGSVFRVAGPWIVWVTVVNKDTAKSGEDSGGSPSQRGGGEGWVLTTEPRLNPTPVAETSRPACVNRRLGRYFETTTTMSSVCRFTTQTHAGIFFPALTRRPSMPCSWISRLVCVIYTGVVTLELGAM